ncbi:MAG: hypothetical protein ACI85O_002236 [Saprospiraceae bacterium]|jgi:hypothetical protein
MKSYTTKSTFTLFFVLFALLLQAQNSGEGTFYHPKQGYYTFGINGGWAYQSNDIRTSFDGFGVGLTLGKNLYYRPGAPLSFDVRGRFLYAKMLGFDGEKSFDIEENEALNGELGPDYVNYPVTIDKGFVYQNHRTDLGELSIEGVFRLNKLRERTGVLVGLYGGIGLDYYLTRTDQVNSDNDAPYYQDYINISGNLSERETANRLKDGILDGSFETNADGFDDGGKLDWMPSLGIELGYQLTPNMAIMAGHRTTFARNNLLDGHQWEDAKNDLYHYTSLGFEWNLNTKSNQPKKPEIEVRIPTSTPHTQGSRYANVRATIRHINSSADVEYFVNNQVVAFDYANGNFAANFNLKPGRNEIILRATNPVGQAQKLLVINWIEDNVISTPDVPTTNNNPPTTGNTPNIRFTNPSRNNTDTENTNYRVRASIANVNNRNGITFTLNGSSQRFNYDTSQDEFTSDINLQEGRNTLIIRASNSYGNDEERTTINLERRGQAPDVSINSPSNNSTVSKSRINLDAAVLHIVNGRNVTMTVNGQQINNVNLVSNKFTKQINLREGNNTIIVRAQNQYGNDEERVVVRYSKPVISTPKTPPVVTINAPTNNSTIDKNTVAVRAKVQNVRNKNDVRLTVNGSNISNFSFNSLSGLLTTTVNLIEGNNTIKVRGTNDDGQDQATVNVRYKKTDTGNKPVVTLTQPTQNPYTSSSKTTTVKARVLHVPNKSGILIELNGRRVTQFGYTTTGQLSVQVSLQEGNNTIRIKATNAKGSDEKTPNIRYNRTKKPPTVNITKPLNNAKVTNAKVNLIATVKNATKNQITVMMDGKSVSGFNLSGTKLTASLTVRPGSHKVTVKATNKDGQAEDVVQFTYNAPVIKPTVRITQPAKDGMTVRTAKTTLKASTTNVSNKKQVSVLLNGKTVAFTFDVRTKLVSAALTLKSGINTIKVRVLTTGGEATAERRITYRGTNDIPTGKLKPEITISSISAPATNPFEPDKARSTIIAIINNITKKNDIVFTYKGQKRTDFTYNVSEKRFQITVDLTRGDNDFEIKATNKSGTDTEARVIIF